mmetsp:Transcript_9022/g.17397  ORF Transcript_9022/g.17397 Transcript_9022/m.17397 type:complete len:147 (-) Transcript_9022:72-512(-)
MLVRRLRACFPGRSYGWEKPEDEWTVNLWHRADSDNFALNSTPEERGFTRDSEDLKREKHWKDPLPWINKKPLGKYGLNTSEILNIELNDNPLGPYDRNDETLKVGEIKTRIIHVLRHFSQVDLRNLPGSDWNYPVAAVELRHDTR